MRFMRRTIAPRRPGGSRMGMNCPGAVSSDFSFSGGVVILSNLNGQRFLSQLARDATTEISFAPLSATMMSFVRCVKEPVGFAAMQTLTSFARKNFAIVLRIASCAVFLALTAPAMAQQQPQPATVPGPFQGLGNILRNPSAPRPKPPANPPKEPAPPPTIIPPGTLQNGAR